MRWFTIIAGLGLASALLFLAVPRVVASVLKAPAFSAVLAAHRGTPQPAGRLDQAAGYLEAAARWEGSGRLRTDLGYLRLLQAAARVRDDSRRADLAGQATAALREGLLRAPAQPHSWVRLAYARTLETGPSPEVAALLAQSYAAGAFVGEITLSRLELLLANWNDLAFDVRVFTGKQVRYAWTHEKDALVDIARRGGGGHVIRLALRSLPGAVDRFDAALARDSD